MMFQCVEIMSSAQLYGKKVTRKVQIIDHEHNLVQIYLQSHCIPSLLRKSSLQVIIRHLYNCGVLLIGCKSRGSCNSKT